MENKIICGDALTELKNLPDESVHCCVTSPPYYGLRDYGIPGQLGLEPTPEEYVAKLVEVFHEVKRVLRKDGTLWLNLGDTYHNYRGVNNRRSDKDLSRRKTLTKDYHNIDARPSELKIPGLKEKDLVGIPWSVAKALQAPYYTGQIKSEKDRIWLAATIDGEGTICGFNHDRADGGGHRTGLHVFITNSNQAMLDEAERIWPASRCEHSLPSDGHLGDVPVYRWIVQGAENKAHLLRELWPHFICKKKQAVLGYNLALLMMDAKKLGHSPQRDEAREKRRLLVAALTDLNHAKNVDIPSWCKESPTFYEDGWYLRSDIIWAKPNPMPESVRDRPTRSHEYIFLMAKSKNYFFDQEAVKEPYADGSMERMKYGLNPMAHNPDGSRPPDGRIINPNSKGKRNIRSVWTITTKPCPVKGIHFATFPPELPERCIKAGTSEKGVCPKCGSPWVRIMRTERKNPISRQDRQMVTGGAISGGVGKNFPEVKFQTIGWRPSCACNAGDPIPATVLDPFFGAGTVGVIAKQLGRNFIGIELKPEYCEMAERRIAKIAYQKSLDILLPADVSSTASVSQEI